MKLRSLARKIRNALERITMDTWPPKEWPSGVASFGPNVTLGRNVSFGGNVFLFGTASIRIGDNTMIGVNTIVHTSTHDYDYHPMWSHRIDRPVEIGKHVWIGAGAIIMPGIKVGDYAVVGAGSVVTGHVPSCAIVAGNPARIMKYRDIEAIKSKSSYIEYPGEAIKKTFLDTSKQCKEVYDNDSNH
jgi:acetyltransferase-like isoleucine patch superfamily enzyme